MINIVMVFVESWLEKEKIKGRMNPSSARTSEEFGEKSYRQHEDTWQLK